jgi:DNA-binding NarL/FixJ family response regulator
MKTIVLATGVPELQNELSQRIQAQVFCSCMKEEVLHQVFLHQPDALVLCDALYGGIGMPYLISQIRSVFPNLIIILIGKTPRNQMQAILDLNVTYFYKNAEMKAIRKILNEAGIQEK